MFAKAHNNIWLQQIRSLMRKVGLGLYMVRDTQIYTCLRFLKSLKGESTTYTFRIGMQLNPHPLDLGLQSSLQHEYSMSPYLINLPNIDARNSITRLRLDMNMLRECKGRQERSDNRACPSCKAHTESVTHFLLACPTFNTIRAQFFNAMQSVSPSFLSIQMRPNCPSFSM